MKGKSFNVIKGVWVKLVKQEDYLRNKKCHMNYNEQEHASRLTINAIYTA